MAMAAFGIEAKIIRAQEHLDSITDLVKPFEHCQCRIFPKADSDDLWIIDLPEPSLALSVVVGDFLFNMRSALDYIVRALSSAEWGRKIMFPLCTTRGLFDQQVGKGALSGVPIPIQALVEGLQPYPERHNPLGVLNKLHNIDKHRALVLAGVVAHETRLIHSCGEIRHILVVRGNLQNGAVIPWIPLGRISPVERHEMKVDGEVSCFVTLHDPAAFDLEGFRIETTLQQILEFIRDTVVPAFQPFLD
jgi:hypothetical protein